MIAFFRQSRSPLLPERYHLFTTRTGPTRREKNSKEFRSDSSVRRKNSKREPIRREKNSKEVRPDTNVQNRTRSEINRFAVGPNRSDPTPCVSNRVRQIDPTANSGPSHPDPTPGRAESRAGSDRSFVTIASRTLFTTNHDSILRVSTLSLVHIANIRCFKFFLFSVHYCNQFYAYSVQRMDVS